MRNCLNTVPHFYFPSDIYCKMNNNQLTNKHYNYGNLSKAIREYREGVGRDGRCPYLTPGIRLKFQQRSRGELMRKARPEGSRWKSPPVQVVFASRSLALKF